MNKLFIPGFINMKQKLSKSQVDQHLKDMIHFSEFNSDIHIKYISNEPMWMMLIFKQIRCLSNKGLMFKLNDNIIF